MAGFVGLNTADKVPAAVATAELGNFFQCFIQVIFTKIALPTRDSSLNMGSRFGFADSNQAYTARCPFKAGFAVNYIAAYCVECGQDRGVCSCHGVFSECKQTVVITVIPYHLYP